MPAHTIERYLKKNTKSKLDIWRFMLPCPCVRKGNSLRIETEAAAKVYWSVDNWSVVQETDSTDTGFGIHFTDIPPKLLKGGNLAFTFFWKDAGHWENKNYSVTILQK